MLILSTELLCLFNHGYLCSIEYVEQYPSSVLLNITVQTKGLDCSEDGIVCPHYCLSDVLCCLEMRLICEKRVYLCIWIVLVSWGCWNKWPQPEWLKTTENCSPTVLEARSPKSGYQQGDASFGVSRGVSLHLPPSGSSWRSMACRVIILVFASVFMWPFLCLCLLFCLLKGHMSLYLEPTLGFSLQDF